VKDTYFWKTYLLFLGALLIVIGVIYFLKPLWIIRGIWLFVIFFTGLIPLVYFLAMSGIRRNDSSSVFIILGANVIKMIIALLLCAVYILKFGAEPVIFATNFFLLYIAYTLFEIHCLLHNLRLPKN